MSSHPSAGHRSGREETLAACAALSGAQLSHPFGGQTALFEVGEKMFAAVALEDSPGSMTLKCEPDYAAALVAKHPEITPAYHVNRRDWITVSFGGSLSASLADELITDFYDLVVSALPIKSRP